MVLLTWRVTVLYQSLAILRDLQTGTKIILDGVHLVDQIFD